MGAFLIPGIVGRVCKVFPLAVVVASLQTGVSAAETVRVGGTGSGLGTLAQLAEAYRQVEPAFRMDIEPSLGSSGGIKAVLANSIDLAVSSRPLRADEVAVGAVAREYGRSAFVMATRTGAIGSLSTAQMVELYSGRVRTWPDGTPVRLVLRPRTDNDTALLGAFSPAVKDALAIAMAQEGMIVALTDQDAVNAIERLPGGMGPTTMALLRSEHRVARALTIDGVEPSLENVASGRYPHVKTFYFILRGEGTPAVRRFLEFVFSAAGQAVLVDTGHVLPDVPKGKSGR